MLIQVYFVYISITRAQYAKYSHLETTSIWCTYTHRANYYSPRCAFYARSSYICRIVDISFYYIFAPNYELLIMRDMRAYYNRRVVFPICVCLDFNASHMSIGAAIFKCTCESCDYSLSLFPRHPLCLYISRQATHIRVSTWRLRDTLFCYIFCLKIIIILFFYFILSPQLYKGERE